MKSFNPLINIIYEYESMYVRLMFSIYTKKLQRMGHLLFFLGSIPANRPILAEMHIVVNVSLIITQYYWKKFII